jgi:hypothetical protein
MKICLEKYRITILPIVKKSSYSNVKHCFIRLNCYVTPARRWLEKKTSPISCHRAAPLVVEESGLSASSASRRPKKEEEEGEANHSTLALRAKRKSLSELFSLLL